MPLNCSNVTIIETGYNGSSNNMFDIPKYKRKKTNFTWKNDEGWIDNRTNIVANTQTTS